jgi:hypothetical protein
MANNGGNVNDANHTERRVFEEIADGRGRLGEGELRADLR